MHQGKAYGVPQSVSPWPLVTRMDILDAAKVDPPKTWDEFIEVCKKLKKPPKLTGYGMCLGLYSDTEGNMMNVIWSHGGKLVEADNKTVALHSPGTVRRCNSLRICIPSTRLSPRARWRGTIPGQQ